MVCLHVCLCTACVPGSKSGQKRVLDSLGAGVTDGYEPLGGCWQLDSGPLEKQPVLLPADPSLQPESSGLNY